MRNPELRIAKFSSTFTHKVARKKWMEITNHLNKMYGPTKDFKEWRKVNNFVYLTIVFILKNVKFPSDLARFEEPDEDQSK